MKNKILTVILSLCLSTAVVNSYAQAQNNKLSPKTKSVKPKPTPTTIKPSTNKTIINNNEAIEYYKKGRKYYRSLSQNDLEKSVESYDKGIELNKNNPYLYAGKAEALYVLYIYQVLRKESKIKQAKLKYEIIKDATFAIDLAPNLMESHRAMSIAYDVQELFNEAREHAQKAVDLDKGNAESYLWLWNTDQSLNPKDKNIITAANLDPNSPLINLFWAIAHNRSKEDWLKNTQIELLNKVIEQSPNNDIAYTFLGIWYEKYKSDHDQAIKNFEKALSINSENSSALYRLGMIYDKKKMDWKAVEYYKKACEKKVTEACNTLKEKNY